MNQKEITRLAVIKAVSFMFDGITDDEHALFVFEVMDEYPDDQVITAIDVNGAKPIWMFENYKFAAFMESLDFRIQDYATEIRLNLLANTLIGA